jgi:hypothetical protein
MSKFMSYNFEKQINIGTDEQQKLMEELLRFNKQG